MMDAVKFLKTLRRMCNAKCRKCEFGEVYRVNGGCSTWQKNHPEEAVAIVEKWAAEHPIKTRQSEFLKQWPDASIDDLGVLKVCPSPISTSHRNAHGGCTYSGGNCSDCRRKFWLAEVEDV